MSSDLTKETSDAMRLNWWYLNVVMETDKESGETQSEIHNDARDECFTPNDFRRFIDKQMGAK